MAGRVMRPNLTGWQGEAMSQSSVAAPLCWVDGRLVGDAPSVRATDHGLTVGDGVRAGSTALPS